MLNNKKANTMLILLIGLGVVIAILFISGGSKLLAEKAKGTVNFINKTIFTKTVDYDGSSAVNHVDKLYEDNAYSFIYVEGCYKEDDLLSKLTSFKTFEEFKNYLHNPLSAKYKPKTKRGCDLNDYPTFLSLDGCWIFSSEIDGTDSCANSNYNNIILTKNDYNQIDYKSICYSQSGSKCHNHALDVISQFTDFWPASPNFILAFDYVDYFYGENWLCGRQEPGPKLWLLCNEELAEKQNENLVLFMGLGEDSLFYRCKCSNSRCEWQKVDEKD